jgi:hypothetical protein
MSSAAAGLPAFHFPQIFSLLFTVFVVGLCLAGALIALYLISRERGSAKAFYNRGFRRFPVGREAKNGASDFSMPCTAARETSHYDRGQFQGRRKSFAR